MQAFQDVFISYGRRDSLEFAAQLNRRLIGRNFTVWFDYDDIPLGVDYQKQIDDGIERADNFLFIISPHSVNSPYCRLELELALKHHKRIIPLLHVEQINFATWQQRNPGGTEEAWIAYQAQGLHDHFQNMHPDIRKINWVYVREGQDDLEAAFSNLLAIFERHQAYVHQHTLLLVKALEWQRQQKRSPYLLIGEERLQAEAWLKERFEDSQPPCTPTDLHCEFITESRKNADNLMTEVFLAYAEENRATADQICRSLRRAGFTVWTNTTDIHAGAEFQQVIDRGIEEADNVVYLLSPGSVRSRWCEHELDYALSLHKRVIPVLVDAIAPEQTPAKVRELQYIDLTDNAQEDNYQKVESDLLRILQQDAAYHETHKLLLTKALKWERQQRNPTILLRGYNLRHAEAWLKIAQQNLGHPPLLLQQTFIEASLRQPPGVSLDVFISYSRADSGFARKLNDALQMQGKRTWFDQESIAAGTADFQQEIHRGIENANTFLFILSPRSVNSPYCADEVEYAAKLNKRIVTLLHQPIDPATLHPELAKVQWLDFNQHDSDFSANFTELLRILDTDVEYLQAHTRLLLRALEWDKKGRNESFLLNGTDLEEAEQWLTHGTSKEPEPTELQGIYINASRQLETARQKAKIKLQRFALGGVSLALVTAIGLGLAAFQQWKRATTVSEGQINAIARYADALLDNDQDFDALLEGIRAARQLKTQWHQVSPETRDRVIESLQKAFYRVKERHRFVGHEAAVISLSFSHDGQMIASASDDGTIKLWDLSGHLLQTIKAHELRVISVRFSPDGQTFASAGDRVVKLWNRSGQLLHTLQGHTASVRGVSFSPDGQVIASVSEDGTIRLWKKTGQSLKVLKGHQGEVRSVTFSPDGQLIASGGEDKTVRLWNRDGRLLYTAKGHSNVVRDVSFSPDSQLLASASEDGYSRLWSKSGTLLKVLEGHTQGILNVSFSPDGKTIATASFDRTIKLWNREGHAIQTIKGHQDWIHDVAFSPNGQMIASASEDGTVKLWNWSDHIRHTLREHQNWVNSVHHSPDGTLIASADEDGTIKLYEPNGQLQRSFQADSVPVRTIQFSPDSQTIASGSKDGTVRQWSRSGQLLTTLKGHTKRITSIQFSPDRQRLASASDDGTIKLWNQAGKHLHTIKAHSEGVTGLSFSPDGQAIASSGKDDLVKIWHLQGELLGTFKGHHDTVRSVTFSPDGQTIVSAGNDKTIRFWSRSGQLRKTVREHTDLISSVRFSPDGHLIASASEDATVNLWSKSGELLQTFKGHNGWVNALSFGPDGKTLASASDDKTVMIWNLESNKIDDHLVHPLSLNELLSRSCGWVENYLKHNPKLDEGDRVLCDGV